MKNLKVLSFALLFWVLVIAWCEKANNQEKVSCEGDDLCPVETNVENSSIEIEDMPSVIINANPGERELGEEWNLEASEWEEDLVLENNEHVNTESEDEPMMKIMVDEDMSAEDIEISESQTCEALWWTWNEWDCTLSDGSKVYF